MHRRPVAAGLVALLAALSLTLSACADAGPGVSADAAAGSQTGFVAGDGSIIVLEPGQRQPAPAIGGPTLEGGTYATADHLGEVQVLNVWASWCAPCRAEAPDLVTVAGEYADRGVKFVGLNTRDSEVAAKGFVERFGITYPNLVDSDGRLQLAFRDTLPPQAIPSTVVLDRQGRVAARILGVASASSLRGVLDTVLEEPA